jgi:hypothetical protein
LIDFYGSTTTKTVTSHKQTLSGIQQAETPSFQNQRVSPAEAVTSLESTNA